MKSNCRQNTWGLVAWLSGRVMSFVGAKKFVVSTVSIWRTFRPALLAHGSGWSAQRRCNAHWTRSADLGSAYHFLFQYRNLAIISALDYYPKIGVTVHFSQPYLHMAAGGVLRGGVMHTEREVLFWGQPIFFFISILYSCHHTCSWLLTKNKSYSTFLTRLTWTW